MNYIKFDLNGYIVDKNIQGIVATSNGADVIHIFYANDTSTTETAFRTRARVKRADGHTIGPIILTLSTASFDTQAEAETFGLAVYNTETEKWDVACRKLTLTAEMLGVKGDIGISIIYDQVNELGAVLATDVNQMVVAKVYEAVDELLTEEEFNQLVEFFLPRDLGDLTDGIKPGLTQKIVIRQGGETKLITLDQLNSLLEDGVTEFKKIKYDINAPAGTLEIGETRWNEESGTLETRLSADVYLQHSQELLFKCGNVSGKDIGNGTAVYISGASGGSPNFYVDKADNTNLTKASRMIGLATEGINENSFGYVCFSGVVNGLNTASYNVGDMLYLSTGGNLTNIRPSGLVVEVGIVIRKHSSSGAIVVSPRYFPRLDDLSNVNFSDSAEGDVVIRLSNGTYANYNLTNKLNSIDAKDLEQDGRLTTNESDIDNLEDGTTVIPTYELKANKNVANGYVGLDTNEKIPLIYLYDVVLGQLEWAGSFNPSIGYPTQTNALDPNRAIRKGDYFIANANGTISGVEYHTGDWAIRSASDWQKIDNTDAVASVNGQIGLVNLTGADINVSGADTTTIADKITAIMTAINNRYEKSEVYTKTEMDNIIEQIKSLYDLEESVLYNGTVGGINVDYANIIGTNFVIMEFENEYTLDEGVTFKKQLNTFTITTSTLMETNYNQHFSIYNKDFPSVVFSWFELYNNAGYLDYLDGGGSAALQGLNIKLTAYKMKPLTAENMSYDNSLSGLDAENVQEAIDELENEIDSLETDIDLKIKDIGLDTPIEELNNHTLREVFEDVSLFDSLQLVTNGDFSDGLTNITTTWNLTANNVVENGVYTITYIDNTSSSSSTSAQFAIGFTPNINEKYYYTFKNKSNRDLSPILILGKSGTNEILETYSYTNVNQYQTNSIVYQTSNDINQIRIAYNQPSYNVGDYFEYEYIYAFNISTLITNSQYSPLYQTTFDLMTDEEIKLQMDMFIEKPYLFIDYQYYGIDTLTVEEMDYWFNVYQSIKEKSTIAYLLDKNSPVILHDELQYIKTEISTQKNDFDALFKVGKNKFDGNFVNGYIILTDGVITNESNAGTWSAIVEIEQDKTYTITKFNGGNRFRLALLDELPHVNLLPITPLYYEIGNNNNSVYQQSHTVSNTYNAKHLLVQVSYDYFDTLPLLQVEEGSQATEYEEYKKVISGDRVDLTTDLKQKLSLFGDFSSFYKSANYDGIVTSAINDTTFSDVYNEYDNLMNSNQIIMSKNLLGYGSDANGVEDINLPIYEYIIKNPQNGEKTLENNSPLILATSGIHGYEKSAVWSLMQFVKQLLTNWRDNDSLASLKSNVTFKIIPVINPGGYNDDSRYNRHGVDLNRNFSHNWENQVNDFKGASALSELESVLVRNWLINNKNATMYIDYHNTGSIEALTYLATQNKEMKNVYGSLIRRLTDIWHYDYGTNGDNIATGWTEGSLISGAVTEAREVVGIHYSAILEMNWKHNGVQYTKEVIEQGVDFFSNYLLAMLNYLNS